MARLRPWRTAPVAGLLWTAVAATAGLGLAACGTGATPYAPAGIDQLVVPTPSPRPGDFVDRIDNVWLPLQPGRSWTYDVARAGQPAAVRTVTVLPGRVRIDRVETTAVRSVLTRTDEQPTTQTDYYAQDTHGNVWWFGREGLWQAGREGARAGLVVTRTPRLGDGYRAAYQRGRVEDVVTVTQAQPIVSLEWTSALSPGAAVWDTLHRGVGIVDRLDTGTGERDTLRPR